MFVDTRRSTLRNLHETAEQYDFSPPSGPQRVNDGVERRDVSGTDGRKDGLWTTRDRHGWSGDVCTRWYLLYRSASATDNSSPATWYLYGGSGSYYTAHFRSRVRPESGLPKLRTLCSVSVNFHPVTTPSITV